MQNKTIVYDKVKWHFPEGKGCPDLETAKRHFKILMDWLKKNKLLSEYGEELYKLPIGEDFSITSDMLTELGNKLLSMYYSKWLKSMSYDRQPDLEVLEKGLKNILGQQS